MSNLRNWRDAFSHQAELKISAHWGISHVSFKWNGSIPLLNLQLYLRKSFLSIHSWHSMPPFVKKKKWEIPKFLITPLIQIDLGGSWMQFHCVPLLYSQFYHIGQLIFHHSQPSELAPCYFGPKGPSFCTISNPIKTRGLENIWRFFS